MLGLTVYDTAAGPTMRDLQVVKTLLHQNYLVVLRSDLVVPSSFCISDHSTPSREAYPARQPPLAFIHRVFVYHLGTLHKVDRSLAEG